MRHLQRLARAVLMGVAMGGVWAVLEYVFGFHHAYAWEAAGITAASTYWACQYDRS